MTREHLNIIDGRSDSVNHHQRADASDFRRSSTRCFLGTQVQQSTGSTKSADHVVRAILLFLYGTDVSRLWKSTYRHHVL